MVEVGTGWLVRMVGVSASVNLPLRHKVQKLFSGTGSPGWSWKKGRKTVVVVVWWYGDSAGNTVEENHTIFSIIQLR